MSTDPTSSGITIVDGGTLPPPAHATAAFAVARPAATDEDPRLPERADEDADEEATP